MEAQGDNNINYIYKDVPLHVNPSSIVISQKRVLYVCDEATNRILAWELDQKKFMYEWCHVDEGETFTNIYGMSIGYPFGFSNANVLDALQRLPPIAQFPPGVPQLCAAYAAENQLLFVADDTEVWVFELSDESKPPCKPQRIDIYSPRVKKSSREPQQVDCVVNDKGVLYIADFNSHKQIRAYTCMADTIPYRWALTKSWSRKYQHSRMLAPSRITIADNHICESGLGTVKRLTAELEHHSDCVLKSERPVLALAADTKGWVYLRHSACGHVIALDSSTTPLSFFHIYDINWTTALHVFEGVLYAGNSRRLAAIPLDDEFRRSFVPFEKDKLLEARSGHELLEARSGHELLEVRSGSKRDGRSGSKPELNPTHSLPQNKKVWYEEEYDIHILIFYVILVILTIIFH